MPRVITDGTPVEQVYEPPPAPAREAPSSSLNGDFVQALSGAIVVGFREAIASMPVAAKPEVKINSPVYVTTPEVRVPPTTVNVPDSKAPIVNIEPATVTLQTNRPSKWKFTFNRDEFGRITTAEAEDISK